MFFFDERLRLALDFSLFLGMEAKLPEDKTYLARITIIFLGRKLGGGDRIVIYIYITVDSAATVFNLVFPVGDYLVCPSIIYEARLVSDIAIPH